MQRNELFREHIKALAWGEGARSAELWQQIRSEDRTAHFAYTTAVFAGAVLQHFGETLGHEELQSFMNSIRHDFRKADPPLKFMNIEGAIRAIYGDDHFLDEMTAEEQMTAMTAVIRKIIDQTPLIKDNIEAFLDEADNLARQWQSTE